MTKTTFQVKVAYDLVPVRHTANVAVTTSVMVLLSSDESWVLQLQTVHNTKLSEFVEVNHLNDMTSLRPANLCTRTDNNNPNILTII